MDILYKKQVQMSRLLLLGTFTILFFTSSLFSSSSSSLEQKIGNMFMVGFYGTTAKPQSQICKDIKKYNISGVILFDFNPVNRKKAKNIANKKQLAQLSKELQACSNNGKLLIAVDQEGGRVQRLKSKYGFYGKFPKASDTPKIPQKKLEKIYNQMGAELQSVGINYNLAPVVDLAINKKNHVIYGLGRSYGSNPKGVAHYSTIFIKSMHRNGILTSLKHFPGHGSSTGDTHKGFVDVTNQWKNSELDPYRILSKKRDIDSVMVAHVMNKNIDKNYPATLSSKTVNGKLRKELGFGGVVITDDLQMGAISQRYTLKQRIKLAVNAGNDILLFGNQLDPKSVVSTKKLVNIMISLVKSGDIKIETIKKANTRIKSLKGKL